MSTKYFNWDGGARAALKGLVYVDSKSQVEHQIFRSATLAVQGWNGLSIVDRAAIIAKLTAAGWIEGEQSKPDKPA